MEGIALVASKFFSILADVRPEIGLLPLPQRKKVRAASLVDAPVMFQGYGALIADFNLAVSKLGMTAASEQWREKLQNVAASIQYNERGWSGDLYEKENPIWYRLGVIKPGLTGQPTVNNNRGARLQVAKVLRAVVNKPSQITSLEVLVP